MPAAPNVKLQEKLAALDTGSPRYVSDLVGLLLAAAREANASDVHFLPTADGLTVKWRVDGVLQPVTLLPAALAPNVVARLKVIADLLTYRSDTPQEGRIRGTPGEIEMRVSSFPTLHGEKAVVRLFAAPGYFLRLGNLGLPDEIQETLARLLDETSGAIFLAGPAGSGKTTTIYACLRELVERSQGQRSLVTLEDPIEVSVPGVSQSQVNPGAGFTLEAGLRSLLRQDPEVIAVGEIRDRATAEVAFQASLTGHLVLTTFHAGSAAGVVGRLSDMGIEPYILRSGVLAIVCQRLVRRLCPCARETEATPAVRLGLPVKRVYLPVGCPDCGSTGYRGRIVLAEMLVPNLGELGRAILSRTDVARLEELARASGMTSRWTRACQAIEAGLTSPAEVRRVLGFADAGGASEE